MSETTEPRSNAQPLEGARERRATPAYEVGGEREHMPSRRRSSIPVGALWMVLISLVLFFVPGINGLIGGLVGGYKVGSVGRGLGAAVLPAVLVAIGMWILLIAFGLPLIGALAGVAVGGVILFADLGLFIGAAIGGAFARA